MATVEMDLAELDKMRDNQKRLEGIITDLRKEKQDIIDAQPRVTIHHKSYKGVIKGGPRVNDDTIRIHGMQIVKDSRYSNHFSRYNTTQRQEPFNKIVSFADLEDEGIITLDVEEVVGESSRDYRNLDSVISDIREEETEKVAEKLKVLTKRAQDNVEKLAIQEGKYEDKLIALAAEKEKGIKGLLKQLEESSEAHQKELEQVKSEAAEKYQTLSQDFEDFKANKKRVTLEEELNENRKQLKDLKKQLEKKDAELEEAKRPWWKSNK